MTGKPMGAAPNTLRNAIRTGLIRVVGEQRYADRVEEIDKLTDGALAEVRRFHQAHLPRRTSVAGIGPWQERLLQHLAAGHGIRRIAAESGRNMRQVSSDVEHLLGLLHARDPLGAVVAGYELGILLPGRRHAS